MNTMRMIAELKTTCGTIESEKKELVSRVKELDDRLTGYRMAIDALELTITKEHKTQIVEAPVAAPKQKKAKRGAKIYECNGKSQTLEDWAKELNMSKAALKYRMSHGWSLTDVLTKPKAPGAGKRRSRKSVPTAARRVFKYDQMNNPVRQYVNIADAARDLRLSESTVQKIIEHVPKGEQLKAHNWYLDYAK